MNTYINNILLKTVLFRHERLTNIAFRDIYCIIKANVGNDNHPCQCIFYTILQLEYNSLLTDYNLNDHKCLMMTYSADDIPK